MAEVIYILCHLSLVINVVPTQISDGILNLIGLQFYGCMLFMLCGALFNFAFEFLS